jgi:hypothetical protein
MSKLKFIETIANFFIKNLYEWQKKIDFLNVSWQLIITKKNAMWMVNLKY